MDTFDNRDGASDEADAVAADDRDALTPPAAPTADDTAVLVDDETAVLLHREPPAPSALPPAFTGHTAVLEDAAPPTATGATSASAAASGPRVRWAGIVWGLVLAAIAALALWFLTDATRQAAAMDWMLRLGPAATLAYAVLAVGALALVAGLVGIARRAQRGVERRRGRSDPASV